MNAQITGKKTTMASDIKSKVAKELILELLSEDLEAKVMATKHRHLATIDNADVYRRAKKKKLKEVLASISDGKSDKSHRKIGMVDMLLNWGQPKYTLAAVSASKMQISRSSNYWQSIHHYNENYALIYLQDKEKRLPLLMHLN